MTFNTIFGDSDAEEIVKSFSNSGSGADRFYSPYQSTYQYPPQNPYQTYEHSSSYSPYQQGL